MNVRFMLRNVSIFAPALTVAALVTGPAGANDDVLARQSDPTSVLMPSLTYNGWNYSELAQINLNSVVDLSMAWTLQIGVLGQFEASPLVVDGVMYVLTPTDATGPNYLIAIDLESEGRILWEFRPDIPNLEQTLQVTCCGAQTRGLNYAEGKVFYHSLDGQVFAIDARTGEAVWRSQGADIAIGETTPGNGIVAGDLYVIGNAGGEFGVRGKVQAFDINDGSLRWVMYNMGPNDEVGIGPQFRPFYADDQIQNPALDSWWGDSWRRGGGTAWGFFTYDSESDLIHYSTGNCGPWNPDYRREWGVVTLDEFGGLYGYKNNYCASQMARDAETGELAWAYNIVPQDQWDFDQPQITPLVDIDLDGDGTVEQAALKASRVGYFYAWDRVTGEIINTPWPFVYVDFMAGVNLATGRPIYNIANIVFSDPLDRERYINAAAGFTPEQIAAPEYQGTEVYACPIIAARNWQNDAWSPQTQLLYVSTSNDCGGLVGIEGDYVAGEGYILMGFNPLGPGVRRDIRGNPTEAYVGELQALDPIAGEAAWSVQWATANNVPIMATGGGLVFQGGSNAGEMRAFNAATGEEVWSFRTGAQFNQSPITYIAPDGRQFIAIISSAASADGVVFFNDAADDADRYSRSGTTLYAFALPRSIAASQTCASVDPAPGFVCDDTAVGPMVREQ